MYQAFDQYELDFILSFLLSFVKVFWKGFHVEIEVFAWLRIIRFKVQVPLYFFQGFMFFLQV